LLRIHILNVGHGDSAVLEFQGADGSKSFAVIDSNCSPGSTPRALSLLQSLGATHLSFVAITHPHADHYMGMRDILECFSGNIETLYTFPIRQERQDIQRLVSAYKAHAVSTDDKDQQKRSLELAYILLKARSAATYWEDPTGTKTTVTASGFDGVQISTLLPPAKVKGDFDRMLAGNLEPENPKLNDLSMAFLVEYAGQKVILGGDGTYSNWMYQANRWKRNGEECSSVAVKLPHHGSKHDCNSMVLNVLFGDEQNQHANAVACISANGKTHPAPEVLDEIVRRGIRPYCTNLARRCGANRRNLVTAQQTDPVLLRLLNSASVDTDSSSQSCQGDIVLELSIGEPLKVATQHANLCPLRGDFDFLGGLIH
jgi:beta-lactamase superfamily II metal-dependent hydrolase